MSGDIHGENARRRARELGAEVGRVPRMARRWGLGDEATGSNPRMYTLHSAKGGDVGGAR